MIPVSLNIQGLYSYKELQHIDFTTLTSSGLFGIFGAVGSGKSSILEAIMFVLYDKSDRLNYSGDNRYYNMLNLQSNELMLDFEFFAGSNNKDKYRFRFRARRSKKDFEKVEVKESNCYQWVDNNWLPLENVNNASEILGMSYQNFMQTIIIPQGRFREFIDRSATDRTKMLKELFHLNKFDLSQKTSLLLNKNKGNINNLEGRLQELGEVDAAQIIIREEELKKYIDLLNESEYKCKASKAEEQKLSLLKNIFLEIRRQEKKLLLLENQKQAIAERELEISAYEKAFTFLKEKIRVIGDIEGEIEKTDETLKLLQKKLLINEGHLQKSESNLAEAKVAYDNREEIKKTCEDLDLIIKIKAAYENLVQFKFKFENEKKFFLKAEGELVQNRTLKTEKEKTLQQLENDLSDISELQKINFWFQRKDDFKKEVEKHQIILDKYQKNLDLLEQEKKKLFSNGQSALTLDEIANFIKVESEATEAKKAVVNQEIQSLLVQKELSDFSLNLKEGEACPLCGSLDHPAVVSIHNVEDVLSARKAMLDEIDLLLQKFNNQEFQLQKLQLNFNNQHNLIKEKKSEYEEAENRLLVHQQSFAWPAYSPYLPETVKEKIKEAEEHSKAILKLKGEIKNIKEDIEKKDIYFNNTKEHLVKLDNEICSEEAKAKTLEGQLKQLVYEKYEKYTIHQLEDSLKKGLAQFKAIEKKYEEAVNNQQELKIKEQGLLQQIALRKEALDQQKEKFQFLTEEISLLLKEKGFHSLQQVKEILSAAMNLEKEKKELEEFHREMHSTRTALEKNYKEADGHQYDEAYHADLIIQLENIETQVKNLRKESALLEREISDLQNRLNVKYECKKDLEKLLIREQNLKELRKLFMGNGFVRYVSSVYLQDLCKAANKRFFKLTNNNLSLELNQEEEFIVRDYLNNGKTRLLKTLSGGQTFQAALCLALALAENVKSLHKAEKSFFFLDEGFGSLDKESLRVVFDTLKTLRKENRIVGIISHVEELQQEIDVYLKIVNDKDRGSLVNYSWI
ncbi:SbcC/MukB-like Walker B domain-containing protein [soil metagenome]